MWLVVSFWSGRSPFPEKQWLETDDQQVFPEGLRVVAVIRLRPQPVCGTLLVRLTRNRADFHVQRMSRLWRIFSSGVRRIMGFLYGRGRLPRFDL